MAPAELIFDWLREPDPLPLDADVVIGFGHFDLRIPALCAAWVRAGRSRQMIFTGGIGAGTANLGGPEADVFVEEIRRDHPDLVDRILLAENRSTNTAENIRFTAARLAERDVPLAFGSDFRTAILVAHAPRVRRVRQTWQQLVPAVAAAALAPPTDFAAETAAYAANGLSLVSQLTGELERLRTYPARGWIAPVAIPGVIVEAEAILRGSRVDS